MAAIFLAACCALALPTTLPARSGIKVARRREASVRDLDFSVGVRSLDGGRERRRVSSEEEARVVDILDGLDGRVVVVELVLLGKGHILSLMVEIYLRIASSAVKDLTMSLTFLSTVPPKS